MEAVYPNCGKWGELPRNHVARDDGKTWQHVTPPAVTVCSKVSQIEAGLFGWTPLAARFSASVEALIIRRRTAA